MYNSNVIETEDYKNYTIKIITDEFPEDPREWDHLGTMQLFHNKYSMGDAHLVSTNQFSGWAEMKEYFIKKLKATIILPVYLYDHSGLALSTQSFIGRAVHAYWDSGQVGFIFCTNEDIRKRYNIKKVTKQYREKAEKALIAEVQLLSYYVSGSSYGYYITDPDDVELEDTRVYGYLGDCFDDIISEAKTIIDSDIEERIRQAATIERKQMELNGQLPLSI